MEKRTDFYDFIDKIQRQDKYIEYIEEENRKLKEFKTKREESMFYFKAQMERAKPKTASEAEDLQKAKEIFEELYRQELSCLEEENKKLKEENDKLVEVIKKLRRINNELEQCNLNLQEWLDNKEEVNKSLREELEWYHGFDNYLTNHGFDMKNLKEKLKNQN